MHTIMSSKIDVCAAKSALENNFTKFYKYVEIKPKNSCLSVVGFFVDFLGGHSQSPKLLSCQPLEATRGSDLDVQASGGYQ